MTRRLNATALAERRYEVAKMNREGMTLAEIGEKLGVDASTVCRDMAWVREEWRKSVVENYDQARAVELAKLNYVERCCWEAWEGRGHVRETRIVVRRLPDGGLMEKGTGTATNSNSTCACTQDMAEPVPFSSGMGWGNQGPTAQERTACHGRKLAHFRPALIHDPGSILRRPGEAYTWAIANPDKVSCTYGENPTQSGGFRASVPGRP